MNERVPDSSGLPLRAIVMVLIFLGCIFLLLAVFAVGNDGGDDSDGASSTSTSAPATSGEASADPSSTEESPAPKPSVQVYNIGEVSGAADRMATRLTEAGWTVTETDNFTLPAVTVNTVYYSDADGEEDAAHEIGKLLEAPVEARPAELADKQPGVIVVVTG